MKKIYLYIILLLIASALKVNAQTQQATPMKENIEYTVDNLGDAHIKFSQTLNASQWENYKKISGSNAPDMWKRQMTRNFPAAYLDKFDYKEEEMNRSYTLSFDAFGFARINDNGQWQIDIGVKNPDVTKISDHNYALTATYNNSQGALIQDLLKLNIPDAASNVTQDKNPLGKPIFTYDLTPPNKAAHMAFLIIGVLLLGGGALVYFKPDLLKKKVKVKPFTIITEQGQTPPKIVTPEPPANPNIEKQA